ncbi:MAG: NADH-quinone oxidoreductase subunit M [Chitinophagales bacterium]|nr:NADH-quinone oxidoreductase subunit M [Chitinophagales bacterium]
MTAIILLILPFLGALLTLLLSNKITKQIALGASILTFLYSIYTYFHFVQGSAAGLIFSTPWLEVPNISFSLEIDGLSLLMLLLTNILTPIIILSGAGSTQKNIKALYTLILVMQGALNGVFMAADALIFYIFWEMVLIPIYFIAALWGTDYSREITFKFFVYALVGSLFMLISVIVLTLVAGSSSVHDIHSLSLTNWSQTLIFFGFFLAFAIKIPIVPLHTWQADTYTAAPTQGTMLLSSLMLKMGLYGFIRWLLPVVPFAIAQYTPIIITLGVIGVVYGAWIAIQQNNFKRLLAYSSLGHVGLIVAGIFTITSMGLIGASVQMIAHGVNVVGLFFAAEIVLRRTGTIDISALGGIREKAPWFSTYLFILVLAGLSLPLTNAFVGEFMLLFSVWQYNAALAVLAGTTVILAAVYLLRMFQRTLLGNSNTVTQEFHDLTLSEHLTFIPIIFMVLFFGVYPMPIIRLVEPVINQIIQLASI